MSPVGTFPKGDRVARCTLVRDEADMTALRRYFRKSPKAEIDNLPLRSASPLAPAHPINYLRPDFSMRLPAHKWSHVLKRHSNFWLIRKNRRVLQRS